MVPSSLVAFHIHRLARMRAGRMAMAAGRGSHQDSAHDRPRT
jgi:hypothetical protein